MGDRQSRYWEGPESAGLKARYRELVAARDELVPDKADTAPADRQPRGQPRGNRRGGGLHGNGRGAGLGRKLGAKWRLREKILRRRPRRL